MKQAQREAAELRTELLMLAEGVAEGQVRRGLADSIVPLTASPDCFDSLSVFEALVEAVHDDAADEVSRLLDLLTRRVA